VRPDCNIVCFRHLRSGLAGSRLDELQDAVRAALVRDGGFYLVKTRLASGLFLRVTIINPFTQDEDLADLLDAVRARASRHVEGGSA
jgi:L-2,4-diaminobutyrate decarboxylase